MVILLAPEEASDDFTFQPVDFVSQTDQKAIHGQRLAPARDFHSAERSRSPRVNFTWKTHGKHSLFFCGLPLFQCFLLFGLVQFVHGISSSLGPKPKRGLVTVSRKFENNELQRKLIA